MVTYEGFHSTGAESRARAAIGLALWDLFGKAGRWINKPLPPTPRRSFAAESPDL
jgi:hypothetical protein